MGPLLLGIILLVVAWLVPLPYVLYVVLMIVGVIALIYGLYLLFTGWGGPPAGPGPRRRVRWY